FAVWPAVHAVAPLPQLIPPPLTLPVPKTETVSVNPVPLTPPLKVAVTLFAWFISTVQAVEVPPHAPVQPTNVPPVDGVATRVTVAFAAKFAEQMFAPLPQLTAPDPPLTLPFPTTLTVSGTGAATKVAVAVRSESIVSVQVLSVPAQ